MRLTGGMRLVSGTNAVRLVESAGVVLRFYEVIDGHPSPADAVWAYDFADAATAGALLGILRRERDPHASTGHDVNRWVVWSGAGDVIAHGPTECEAILDALEKST